jgi:uncharacterized membrane protein
MIYGAIQAHQIANGTHPYWSKRLEAAGVEGFKKRGNGLSTSTNSNTPASETVAEHNRGVTAAVKWTSVNGIPIPTLATLMGTSRE